MSNLSCVRYRLIHLLTVIIMMKSSRHTRDTLVQALVTTIQNFPAKKTFGKPLITVDCRIYVLLAVIQTSEAILS